MLKWREFVWGWRPNDHGLWEGLLEKLTNLVGLWKKCEKKPQKKSRKSNFPKTKIQQNSSTRKIQNPTGRPKPLIFSVLPSPLPPLIAPESPHHIQLFPIVATFNFTPIFDCNLSLIFTHHLNPHIKSTPIIPLLDPILSKSSSNYSSYANTNHPPITHPYQIYHFVQG